MNMGKYDPLYSYLLHRKGQSITLQFGEIEKIIGDSLPASAYKYVAWWGNSKNKTHPHSFSWLDAGFQTVNMTANIDKRIVEFKESEY